MSRLRLGVRRSFAAFQVNTKRLVFAFRVLHFATVRQLAASSWPHAPTHQLSSVGTYFVTAGTYEKKHCFRKRQYLDALQHELLTVAQEFGWTLEAWAVFSNHYHFVARSPTSAEDAQSLSNLLTHIHRRTAIWLNERDKTTDRKIWHNFWDTQRHIKNRI